MISVILPVWNGERFLEASIESILNQSFKDFELIIVDDYSSDDTPIIIKKYSKIDMRIRIFRNSSRRGVGATLNRAIKNSKGKYLARSDADDLMAPDRLEFEVAFLQKHPSVVAVGSWVREINSFGVAIGERKMPITHKGIVEMMFYAMGMQNPSVMFNRGLIPKNFPWCKETGFVDDLDLLFRLIPFGKFANIPKLLVDYRIHDNNLSLKNPKKTFIEAQKIRKMAVARGNYQPTFKARIINLIESIVVGLIPESAVIPGYNLFRKLTT